MMICIEGIDASGKATQSKWLAEKMSGQVFSFPNYNTATGKLISAHLQNEWWTESGSARNHEYELTIDALVFQSLMLTNRMEAAFALEAARSSHPVILDRYWPSGYAYGKADGLDPAWLLGVHKWLPRPDLFLLLDVDPADSVMRRPQRRDRYEKDHDRMQVIARNYRDLWVEMRQTHTNSWKVINARGTKEETQEHILETLETFAELA